MTFGKNLWGQKVKYFPMILQRTSIKNQAKKLFLETGKIAAAMKYVWIKRDPCSALYEILMILKILLRSTKNAFIMQSHSRILDRSSTPICPPPSFGRNYSGQMTKFSSTMCSTLFPGSLFSASGSRLLCALSLVGVQFHFCLVSWCASLRVWPLRIWCAFLLNSGLCFLVYFICSRTGSPRLRDVP